MSKPVKRRCRPGYKSRSKILRSANRLQVFLADKIRQENLFLKSENVQLKKDLTISFIRQKDKVDIEHLELTRHVESLKQQLTLLKKNLYDKEEEVNTANTKINSLENDKIINEEKLISYRSTVRKLMRDKGEKGKVEDKGKQK